MIVMRRKFSDIEEAMRVGDGKVKKTETLSLEDNMVKDVKVSNLVCDMLTLRKER